MNVLRWLHAKFSLLLNGSRAEQEIAEMRKQKEAGKFIDTSRDRTGVFDEDYWSATHMLKARMNKNFPDNYHARLSSNEKNPYDHGEDRALAIDAASTAIAMALRNGATVRQAAEASAMSVGI